MNSSSLNFSQKQRGAKKEINIHHEYLPEDFGEFKLVRYPTGMREDYQVLSVIEHLTLIIIIRSRTIILIIKRIRYQLQSIHHLKPLLKKINVPDNSSGPNFPNPLMSVKNVYNCDAYP